MSDFINWDLQLQALVKYCRRQGVDVIFKRGCETLYNLSSQSIEVNSRSTNRNQTYLLLHEIGHHKIIKSEKYSKKFTCLNTSNALCSLSKKILTLEEEVVAWHIGEDIAQELNIPLDVTYQVLKSKCLKAYALLIS